MYRIILLLSLAVAGCFYIGKNQYDDIIKRNPEEWSTQECLTVIMSAARYNFNDPRSSDIKAVAIPYYPSVISAIMRRAHILGPLQYPAYTYNHTEDRFRHDLDTLMAAQSGVYIDWKSNRYVDSHGNYLRDPTQLDSLMFYVSVWSDGTRPGTSPDITDLEKDIYLVNDRDEIERPLHVTGKKNTRLITEEKLLVMFPLRLNGHHFLGGCEDMFLVIKGLGDDIRLKFPVSMIK